MPTSAQFENLAERFDREAQSGKPGAGHTVALVNLDTEAARLIVQAFKAGQLQLPHLPELIAYHTGDGPHPAERLPSFSRCELNLFGDVIALLAEEDDSISPAVDPLAAALTLAAAMKQKPSQLDADSEDILSRRIEIDFSTRAKACRAIGRRMIELPPNQHASFNTAQLCQMTGLANTALNKHAKGAGVGTPGRGKKNHRYTHAEAKQILTHIAQASSEERTQKQCANSLRNHFNIPR